MRSLAKLGFVAVGIGLMVSVAACAITSEDTDSSTSDLSRRGPGNGRRPIGPPILADDDAGPPAIALVEPAVVAADDDAGAPAVVSDEDAGEAPVGIDEDAGPPPEPEPEPEPEPKTPVVPEEPAPPAP